MRHQKSCAKRGGLAGFSLLLACALVWSFAARAEAPRVVASIKPIHSLAAAVMEGVGIPALIVRGAASEHGYQLRPSDAKTLSEAQLVFWIGPILENYLAQPLATLAPGARLVELGKARGVRLLPARSGGDWERDDDEPLSQGNVAAGGEVSYADPHLWLDPVNAIALLHEMAAQLTAIDPADGPRFAANAEQAEGRIRALDASLQARLAPLRPARFVVFHDAYQYFERHFGLAAIGSVTVDPEHQPGARRIAELHRKIISLGAACVFTEPQFEPAIVKTIIAGTPARMSVLDPIGATLPEGPDLYPGLLRQLADNLVACLAKDEQGKDEQGEKGSVK